MDSHTARNSVEVVISLSQTRPDEEDRLRTIMKSSPTIERLLSRSAQIGLTDGHICAGCIAQTVWNHATGRPPLYGIADIDVIYHEPADLSEEGETQATLQVAQCLGDLPVKLDVKNEARVHLWYAARFGKPIDPIRSISDAVITFPTTATAVAVALDDRGSVVAPFGLDDLLGLIVRPNRRQVDRPVYDAKIVRWRRLWPEITYLPWQDS